MITDDDRREVARRLRDSGGRLIDMGELAEMLGFHRYSWSAGMLADRIADLIEPCCDRDALLALAEEMEGDAGCNAYVDDCDVYGYARRIREALGVEQ